MKILIKKLINLTEKYQSVFATLANVAVAATLIVIFCQLSQSKNSQKTENAFKVIQGFYSPDFIKNTALLNTDSVNKKTLKYIDAMNFIYASYYFVAIIYNTNVSDTSIIKKAIKNQLNEFYPILDTLPNKKPGKNEIIKMWNDMQH